MMPFQQMPTGTADDAITACLDSVLRHSCLPFVYSNLCYTLHFYRDHIADSPEDTAAILWQLYEAQLTKVKS